MLNLEDNTGGPWGPGRRILVSIHSVQAKRLGVQPVHYLDNLAHIPSLTLSVLIVSIFKICLELLLCAKHYVRPSK